MKAIHIISGLSDGGAEAVLYRLCSEDKSNTHTVISLTEEGKYGPLLRIKGIQVYQLNMPRGCVTLSSILKLYRLLRNLKPDVVQTWMYHADLVGGLVARLAGTHKIYWGIHASSLETGKSKWHTIAVAYTNALLSRWVPTGIICCAERAQQTHQQLGFAVDRFTVIPNGYNLDHFKPDSESRKKLRAELGINEQTLLLGCVGRFDPQKDHHNLLAALTIIKQNGVSFRCILVGRDLNGNNVQLVSWIKQYDLQDEVLLLGQRTDIPAVMNALDLHILSSSYGEAFPNVLAEAMACGTPCVATDVGDAAYIIGHTGWTAPPSDAGLLANAIHSALVCYSNHDEWQSRCVAARNRVVETFGLEKMIAAYHAVWGNNIRP
ncbi:glycosyltransferase involved in cell wall bisynthesis [Nitrosomonas sp. PY1]|uniref:glycosyltransferase family 4 protein n=1 Tax=Nitrosomonas sp. PY1 TaxID=1803906 RepID=UPI001FC83D19|nr:glycosyltransferase [Nitrosomonas sp. PY1]GKS68269.1 glycosyltransferase involved in cell wall bisynthesis [Nitrosomonas sp. PY1]